MRERELKEYEDDQCVYNAYVNNEYVEFEDHPHFDEFQDDAWVDETIVKKISSDSNISKILVDDHN